MNVFVPCCICYSIRKIVTLVIPKQSDDNLSKAAISLRSQPNDNVDIIWIRTSKPPKLYSQSLSKKYLTTQRAGEN